MKWAKKPWRRSKAYTWHRVFALFPVWLEDIEMYAWLTMVWERREFDEFFSYNVHREKVSNEG